MAFLPVGFRSLNLRCRALLEERVERYEGVREILPQRILSLNPHLTGHIVERRQPLVCPQVPLKVTIVLAQVGIMFKAACMYAYSKFIFRRGLS